MEKYVSVYLASGGIYIGFGGYLICHLCLIFFKLKCLDYKYMSKKECERR